MVLLIALLVGQYQNFSVLLSDLYNLLFFGCKHSCCIGYVACLF